LSVDAKPRTRSAASCPPNEVLGGAPGRQVMFSIQCDPSTPGFQVLYVDESPTCFYNVFMKSAYGCSQRYAGPDASTDPTGDPNQFIGLDGGAAFGCIVAGAVVAFGVWFGVNWYRK
jgi:hypothetical protein